jgi:hypothetical protein
MKLRWNGASAKSESATARANRAGVRVHFITGAGAGFNWTLRTFAILPNLSPVGGFANSLARFASGADGNRDDGGCSSNCAR